MKAVRNVSPSSGRGHKGGTNLRFACNSERPWNRRRAGEFERSLHFIYLLLYSFKDKSRRGWDLGELIQVRMGRRREERGGPYSLRRPMIAYVCNAASFNEQVLISCSRHFLGGESVQTFSSE